MFGLILAVCFSFKYDGVPVTGEGSRTVDERLSVEVESRAYPEFDAEEWVLWFRNPSERKSGILSDIFDCDCLIPLPPSPNGFPGNRAVLGERTVTTMKGCVDGGNYSYNDPVAASEFAAVRHSFSHAWAPKKLKVASLYGRPSDGECPFFQVSQDGQGAVIALGWTGGWQAAFTNRADGVQVTAGLKDARFYLEPGEKLRTCRVLVMRHAKDEDVSNKFRRLVRRHFSHVATRPGTREGLYAFELWGGLNSSEMIRRIKALETRGLTFEDYWVDAGWYGACKKCDDAFNGDWSQFTGDWYMNPRVHPNGMKDVGRAAKDVGGGIMLWFEPERVVQTSAFVREHGNWLLGKDYSRLLYYGRPEARKYVADLVTGYAHDLGLSCYRQDFNFGPEGIFREADEKDRRGITEIRHVLGMYALWDEILTRNPGIVIDNCSSGGRRLDLETLRRSVFFFRSDYQCGFNADPDVVQTHNAALSRLIPFSGCTTKASDLYALRSSYSSSFGVAYWNAVFQDEKKVDWAAAKKSHEEYPKIRRFFSRDFYNHGSAAYDPSAWAVWQYHDPETNEGVVLAFRRAASPCDRANVTLRGIPVGAKVKTENLDSGVKGECDGTLVIELPERRSSTIVVYRL